MVADDGESGGHGEQVDGHTDENGFANARGRHHHLEPGQKFTLFAHFDLVEPIQLSLSVFTIVTIFPSPSNSVENYRLESM